jgi:CheY-like chemotaxis protein
MFDPKMAKQLPLRILMVEDNSINQNLVSLMLERMGYRCDQAGNGREALEAVCRQTYDVVLMDVQMPEMDGLEATRRIRRDCSLELQPHIIAMTAHAMSGDREICLEAGMDDYISKPIHIEELVNSLNRCKVRSGDRQEPFAQAQTRPNAQLDRLHSPESEAVNEPIINRTELEHLRNTLGARAWSMLPTLVSSYFKQAEKLIDDLEVQIHGSDLSEVQRLAHTLKSNSASFGATRLAKMALQLELLAHQKSLIGANSALEQIRAEYILVKQYLLSIQQDMLEQ